MASLIALYDRCIGRRPAAAHRATRHRSGLLHVRPDQGRRHHPHHRRHLRAVPHRICVAANPAPHSRDRRNLVGTRFLDPAGTRTVHAFFGICPVHDDADDRALRLSRCLADAFELGGDPIAADLSRRRRLVARQSPETQRYSKALSRLARSPARVGRVAAQRRLFAGDCLHLDGMRGLATALAVYGTNLSSATNPVEIRDLDGRHDIPRRTPNG